MIKHGQLGDLQRHTARDEVYATGRKTVIARPETGDVGNGNGVISGGGGARTSEVQIPDRQKPRR